MKDYNTILDSNMLINKEVRRFPFAAFFDVRGQFNM